MKNFKKLTLVDGIIVLFNISCKHSETLSKTELKKIVDQQNEMLGTCFKEGNVDKLAEMYTDSAKLSPNGADFVIGRNRIKAFWAEDFKTSKVLEMKTTVLTIDGNESVIYETGKANSRFLVNDTSTYKVTVKYINVWRKQPNGNYQLDVDFWNKDAKQ